MTATIDKVDVVERETSGTDYLKTTFDVLKSHLTMFGDGHHAEYSIAVTINGNSHYIVKRFSEFKAFHESLKEIVGPLPFGLPPKTPMRNLNPQALDDRKQALNVYLKELCKSPELINRPEVQRFFAAAERSRPYSNQPPRTPYEEGASGNYPGSAALEHGAKVQGASSGRQQRLPADDSDEGGDLAGWDS